VAGVPRAGSTGGASRARHIFRALAERTGATTLAEHGRRGAPRLVTAIGSASGGWRHPVWVASTELLPGPVMAAIRGPVHPALLDLHDEPVLQTESLDITLAERDLARLTRMVARNTARFERMAVPSASFAELCGLPADRVIVISNGSDTEAVSQHPPISEPVVGLVSGAAPGRGIEGLIEAVGQVRAELPETTLRMALNATGAASAAYLDTLQKDRTEPWVTISDVAHDGLDGFLAQTAVLAIPHPPGAYLDSATPVKLFDSMAAGRPVAVTPRFETRRIVEDANAGVVAASDRVEDLAEAIWWLLRDEAVRHGLGDNARRAAVERYDWRILSGALADAMLDG
jgi:glycosyltransferase involved in cell wall biosynthesis